MEWTYVDVREEEGVLEEAAWDTFSMSWSESVRESAWPLEEELAALRAVKGVAGRLPVVRKEDEGL